MNPPIVEGRKAEKDGVMETARSMLVASRTAPKTSGVDDVLTRIVYGREKDAIAKRIEKIGKERQIEAFRRDAKNVRDSVALVLIGVRGSRSIGLNCGGCGFESCKEFDEQKEELGKDFFGPSCIFKILDLGIALSSAAKTASLLNVDNRIMYRIGVAVMKLNLMPEATIVMGIPVSASGKNIYFDRAK